LLPSSSEDELLSELKILSAKPPLSKFGIEPVFAIFHSVDKFIESLPQNAKVYRYKATCSYKFHDTIETCRIAEDKLQYPILSLLKVDLNEKDYE